MSDSETTPDKLPQRLCSEVQLFDLCELDSCSQKVGRFCSDPVLLSRFEKIADDEIRIAERYASEEPDDSEAEDGFNEDGYDEEDDRFNDDDAGDDKDTGWRDEE